MGSGAVNFGGARRMHVFFTERFLIERLSGGPAHAVREHLLAPPHNYRADCAAVSRKRSARRCCFPLATLILRT
ncbi:hypothetical protein FF011L_14710 [Roseimaritima multifibrata]|uniref:Uncharacterized protein n=1 Tax=Roseimaritima multifibrata TaxID=1930274 RepID=A0A517MCV6_9BACT|nr:hypothetical protein FF011L_14710 [Roseimaritima multifibrata]